MRSKSEPAPSTYLYSWLALLILLALTVASTFIPLGNFHLVVNIGIAVLKMLVVMLFFMHIRYSNNLIRLVSFAAFFWIALLIGLTLIDNMTRTIIPSPW